jgi:hypothetical protein
MDDRLLVPMDDHKHAIHLHNKIAVHRHSIVMSVQICQRLYAVRAVSNILIITVSTLCFSNTESVWTANEQW